MKMRSGFTLLEMSIVLVIIGLLAASILVGQTLIRQAKINSAMSDAQHYISAVNQFRDKYGSLPGDMGNATTYWGTNAGGCPPANGYAVYGSATCNGDGNSQIASGNLSTAVNYNEAFLFWQHLADAGLIQGTYTGASGGPLGNAQAYWYIFGLNAPESRLSSMGFGIQYAGVQNGASIYYAGNYGHVFQLGRLPGNFGGEPAGPVLYAAEAASFDMKYDDGLPGTGNVRIFSFLSSCASSATQYNAASTTLPTCAMVLITGF